MKTGRQCFFCTYKAITETVPQQWLKSEITLSHNGGTPTDENEKVQKDDADKSVICQVSGNSGNMELGTNSTDPGFISGKILSFQMYKVLNQTEANLLYNKGTLP